MPNAKATMKGASIKKAPVTATTTTTTATTLTIKSMMVNTTTTTGTTPSITVTTTTTAAASPFTGNTVSSMPINTPGPDTIATTPSEIGPTDTLLGKTVGNTPYIIDFYLSHGCFGALFVGHHSETNERVAIKVESRYCERPQLHLEFGFYHQVGKRTGIPRIFDLGPVGETFTAMVMELLGPSLASMLNKCQRFSLRTIVQLTIQLIKLMSQIHDSGLIYRDVKPQNFLLGLENSDRWWIVHIIDLGFAKHWRLENGSHMPYQEDKGLIGTVRYVSINSHLGRELSRRDDLESLAYMLIYLYRGTLPWMNINNNLNKNLNKIEKCNRIGLMKMNIKTKVLCQDMPIEYGQYLSEVKRYSFDETPNYSKFEEMFAKLLAKKYGLLPDEKIYDWDSKHNIKSIELRSF